MIKRLLKYLLIAVVVFLALGLIVYLIVDKPLPEGRVGLEAEQLADEMLAAINKEGYDSLEYIEFTFRASHHFQWDKVENKVRVKWEDQDVYLDLNRSVNSLNLLELQAYKYFINDSFWLVAPYKVKDAGVTLATVDLGNAAQRGLLVTYSSGGLTPGDSYLWIIDDNGFPIAWKLWTSNVPIGGLRFSWDGWINMDDKWFSTMHESKIVNIPINVVAVR